MKRLFILATAAIVALASCAKTQVVYNDAPEEIAFKTVNSSLTKADKLGDEEYEAMSVYAFKEDGTQYFEKTVFSPASEGAAWTANPAKYWPLDPSEVLSFVYFAPSDLNPTEVTKASIEVDITNDEDFMYGNIVVTGTKQNTAMSAPLRHALAKITVTVMSDLNELTIKGINLSNAGVSADLHVDYSENNDGETANDDRLTFDNLVSEEIEVFQTEVTDGTSTYEAYCYVVPSNQSSLVLTYTLPDSDTILEYEHELNSSEKWMDGHHYTYNFVIGANEIKFNVSEEGWTVVSDVDVPTVDPNNSEEIPSGDPA